MTKYSNPTLVYIFYALNKSSFTTLSLETQRSQDIGVLITEKQQFILAFHFRLCSYFYSNQLTDLFAYDVSNIENTVVQQIDSSRIFKKCNVEVCIFSFFLLQKKIFLFVLHEAIRSFRICVHGQIDNMLKSLDDLYKNAWWAERETGELFGIVFTGKNDARNLLLQYGMTDYPMQKFFPTIGTSEIVYYQLIDAVIKIPLALQY